MKNKLHILVSVSKIYHNVNDYVAIVTSYSARMLYLGPTRDMYSEIWVTDVDDTIYSKVAFLISRDQMIEKRG